LLETRNFIQPLASKLQQHFAESPEEVRYPQKHILIQLARAAGKITLSQRSAHAYFFTEKQKECTSWFVRQGDSMISVYSFSPGSPPPNPSK